MKTLMLTGLMAVGTAYMQVHPTNKQDKPQKKPRHEIKYEFHRARGGMKAWWGWKCLYDGASGFPYDTKAEAEEIAAQHVVRNIDW